MKKLLAFSVMFLLAFSSKCYAGYFVDPPAIGGMEPWKRDEWEKEEVIRQYESWANPSIEDIKQITDEKERYRAVFNLVCNHFSYDLEVKNISQIEAILLQKGVCQHYANAIRDIGSMCGLTVEYISGWNGALGDGHAWNRVTIDGEQYWTDASGYDSCGDFDMFFLSKEKFRGIYTYEEMEEMQAAAPEGMNLQYYTDGTYGYVPAKVLTEEEKQELYEKYGLICVD